MRNYTYIHILCMCIDIHFGLTPNWVQLATQIFVRYISSISTVLSVSKAEAPSAANSSISQNVVDAYAG